MELKSRLLRAATARPGVLLAVRPGATRERLFVEAELVRRGWPCAAGPASANLLVCVGEPTAAEDDWAERLWLGIPAPKARVTASAVDRAVEALDRGLADLFNGVHQHRLGHHEETDGSDRHRGHHDHQESPDPARESGQHAHDDHDSHGSEHANSSSAGAHQHGGHDGHASHEGHNGHAAHGMHGDHDMGVVAGLPMAARADDRDGLRLDRLHVPLGPVLADWPAGLVLRLELQGDVVQRAAVERIAAPTTSRPPFWNEPWLRASAGERVARGDAARRLCAAHLDSLGRFLAVAGWDDAAAQARHVRDRALAGVAATELASSVVPLIRRIRRSRTLRWLTSGLGVLLSEHAHHLGVTGPALVADGDVHRRMLVWLDEIERSAGDCDAPGTLGAADVTGPRGRTDGANLPSQGLLDVLPGLLEGAEFACARLIVASLDPDLDEFTWATTHTQGPADD